MADEDKERAAKAARAKALLKSRQAQKKKAATPTAAPGPSSLSQLIGSAEDVTAGTAASLFSGPPSEAGGSEWDSVIAAGTKSSLNPPPAHDTATSPLSRGQLLRRDSSASLSSLSGTTRPVSRGPTSPLAAGSVPASLPQVMLHESIAPTHPTPSSRPSTPATQAVGSPKQPPPSRPGTPANHDNAAIVAQLQATVHNQQQTINLLVSEKASLTANLAHLEGVELRSQNHEALLAERADRIQTLSAKTEELEHDLRETSEKLSQLTTKEHATSEHAGNIQRELDLSKHSVSELKAQLTQTRNHVKQLEEQIESDDRVEILEKSLKTVQERAESLEFQLSKLKQSHAKAKADRDSLEQNMSKHVQAEKDWQQKHESLANEHSSLQSKLETLTSERDSLRSSKEQLEQQVAETGEALVAIKVKVSQLSTEHGTATRQISSLQNELTASKRRADHVEEAHRTLQAENVELMNSLNEMRGKTVELNTDKVELGEHIERLQSDVRQRDATIASLEASLDQANARSGDLEAELNTFETTTAKARASMERTNNEREHAFAELDAKLRESQAIANELMAERNGSRVAVGKYQAQVDHLQREVAERTTEIESLRRGMQESDGVIRSLEAEVKSLRADGATKDEDLHRLKEELESAALGTNSIAPAGLQGSLSDEMLDTVKQQHELEQSEAKSRIRSLETEVFQEQAKTHTLQRRVQALEDDLRKTKAQLDYHRSQTPPPALSRRTSAEYRKLALGASPIAPRRPLEERTPSSLTLDSVLSPDARHKRKISLSMLKARIESEMHLRKGPSHVTQRVNALGTTAEEGSQSTMSISRPQFGDETHVFCCASCNGDLVVL